LLKFALCLQNDGLDQDLCCYHLMHLKKVCVVEFDRYVAEKRKFLSISVFFTLRNIHSLLIIEYDLTVKLDPGSDSSESSIVTGNESR